MAALFIALALDSTEVTNAQYRLCVQAKMCRPPAFEDPGSAANLQTGKEETADAYRKVAAKNLPAVGVSWDDAGAYCSFAGCAK